MSENLSERERLAAVIYKAVMAGGWTESFDGDTIAIDGEVIVSKVVDALLAAGFGDVAQAKADALDRAAATIPERMRMDELGMHQISHTDGLPKLSQVMLNGATRFAERLSDMAAEYRAKSAQ